jgi:argininosuccinate synthase
MYEVHTVLINTGDDTELNAIEERAYELGSTKHATITIVDKYYDKAIKYLIYGNVLKTIIPFISKCRKSLSSN